MLPFYLGTHHPVSPPGSARPPRAPWTGHEPSVDRGRFDVLAVGSPLHDAGALQRALEPSLRALACLGGREAGEAALAAADPLVLLVGTGGTEAEILRLHAARPPIDSYIPPLRQMGVRPGGMRAGRR